MDTARTPWPGPAETQGLPGVYLAWGQAAAPRVPRSGVPVFVGFVQSASQALGNAAGRASPMRPVVVDHWEDRFAALPARALGYLDDAIKGFFENGGIRCWIWPVAVAGNVAEHVRRQALLDCFAPGSPLEDLEEPDLVCVPDAAAAGEAAEVLQLQQAVLGHCSRLNDRMALLDCLPLRGPDGKPRTPQARLPRLVSTWPARAGTVHTHEAASGALYWPWIVVSAVGADRAGNALRTVPPCGHVAGMVARIDASAGRHKAPANEALAGAHDVDQTVPAAALAELHAEGANGLRVLPGHGVMVCGARTLSDLPAYRHIGARRVVLGLVRWAESGLRDLVLESHEPALWERIRQRLCGWCHARYLEGALRGETPEEAYFVQCDAETNPPEARDQGRVQCRVGLAAAVPAEFIVLQLIQSADGAALAG